MRNDYYRFYAPAGSQVQAYRGDYRRDFARVLHSASFRRLEHKTQLFPGSESDYFRTRLTHSLEVGQIAKSIALKIRAEHREADVEPDVCEIAGLLHDIGHPPFGHNGERALDRCMIHFGGFEGNAQTLRVLCRLEKKELIAPIVAGRDVRVGLNLTARSIASVLKYDCEIPVSRRKGRGLVKGYYASERPIVDVVKEQLDCKGISPFKTIDCGIMDLADDIAYSTYDLEDAFKAGFLTPLDMMAVRDDILEQIIKKLKNDGIDKKIEDCRIELYNIFSDTWLECLKAQKSIFPDNELFEELTLANMMCMYNVSKQIASDGYLRTAFTANLVNRFIDGIVYQQDSNRPLLSKVEFDEHTRFQVNLLKHFAYVCLINSPRLKVVENRGEGIVEQLFEKLAGENGYIYLPEDYQVLYHGFSEDVDKKRLVCDFVAGMTDRYALEFYDRLFSENAQSIFKPL